METDQGTAVVADAMIRFPEVCGPATTVADARAWFVDDHVHALLVVDRGVLVAVVDRADVASAPTSLPVAVLGRLAGRTTDPAADLDTTRIAMARQGRRRLAVVDDRGTLLGLLCLKRTGRGFCSDADVRARAAER